MRGCYVVRAYRMMQLGLFSRKGQCTPKSPSKRSSMYFSVNSPLPADSDQEYEIDRLEDEEDEAFYPSFAEIRRVLISCILATDMELFRHHHEAMRKRAQMKRSED